MEVIFILSFLALIAVWVLTSIGLISPKRLQSLRKSKELTRKDVLIGGGIGSIILFIVIGVTVPDPVNDGQNNEKVSVQNTETIVEDKVPSLLDQIKEYDKTNILAVRTHGENVLEIDMKATGIAFSDAGYLDHSGRNAKDILVQIVKNNSNEKFKIVRFIIIGELTDQYNKTFESPIFQLTYDLNEVKKINLGNGYVDYKMFLNFSKFGMRHPVADSIYKDWCAKKGNADQSGNFCK